MTDHQLSMNFVKAHRIRVGQIYSSYIFTVQRNDVLLLPLSSYCMLNTYIYMLQIAGMSDQIPSLLAFCVAYICNNLRWSLIYSLTR